MASIIPEVLNHFNIYNGANALVGVSGEVELPELEAITDTVEGTGVLGDQDPVTGQFSTPPSSIPFQFYIQRYVLLVNTASRNRRSPHPGGSIVHGPRPEQTGYYSIRVVDEAKPRQPHSAR